MSPTPTVTCFGEAMLRHALTSEERLAVTPGGAEYNVACSLAALGIDAKWVSALPLLDEAELITSPADVAGVRLSLIRTGEKLGTYLVLAEEGRVEYDRKDSSFAGIEAGSFYWKAELSGSRWLVLSGITPLLGDGPMANWGAAMTFAELEGTLIALDLNHRPALSDFDELWSIVEPRLRQVHLLVLSTNDLERLAGEASEESLRTLRSKWNLPFLACTWKEGYDGCQRRWSAIASSTGFASTSSKPTIHDPKDPLGGGDAWLAGVLAGLVRGEMLEQCCRQGDLVAALVQESFGDLGEIDLNKLSALSTIEGQVDLRRSK